MAEQIENSLSDWTPEHYKLVCSKYKPKKRWGMAPVFVCSDGHNKPPQIGWHFLTVWKLEIQDQKK